jgi:hypothetical protein
MTDMIMMMMMIGLVYNFAKGEAVCLLMGGKSRKLLTASAVRNALYRVPDYAFHNPETCALS